MILCSKYGIVVYYTRNIYLYNMLFINIGQQKSPLSDTWGHMHMIDNHIIVRREREMRQKFQYTQVRIYYLILRSIYIITPMS